jgi:hypothetical protein
MFGCLILPYEMKRDKGEFIETISPFEKNNTPLLFFTLFVSRSLDELSLAERRETNQGRD